MTDCHPLTRSSTLLPPPNPSPHTHTQQFRPTASLTLGGLATGQPFHAVRVPALIVFLGIYHREILMDIDDVEGDAQCRIMTLPRLLGRNGALLMASGLFAGGSLLSARHLLTQVGPGEGGGEGGDY
jgi:1,4-dihydroxy-2-naphthoate octaprenyltransferase